MKALYYSKVYSYTTTTAFSSCLIHSTPSCSKGYTSNTLELTYTSTVFGIRHRGRLSQDQFFFAVPLVSLVKLSLCSLLRQLHFVVLTVLHLLSLGNIFLLLGLRLRFGLVWLHGLVGESPRTCMSHGPLGGRL